MDSSNRLDHFPGGLALPEHKAMTNSKGIAEGPMPKRLFLPLTQHIGEITQPCVKIGDKVLRGQTIARSSASLSAPIHASSSGTIVDIGDYPVPHPSGLNAPCIVIEPDGEDTWVIEHDPAPNCQSISPEEVRQRIHGAGIVGLGGAAFPTGLKLTPQHGQDLHTLIINGAECEPYISCDDILMRECASQIIQGAQIIAHALQLETCIIGVEDCQQPAIKALRAAATLLEAEDITITEVPSLYPAGGERQLIKVLLGQEVPEDGRPHDLGVVCQNVGTAVASYHAICHGKPLTSRIVTVTGAGVEEPRNFEVRIGTPFADLIEAAGGYSHDIKRLIMGGPMMGFAVGTDEVPVVKATNCVLAAGLWDLGETEPPQPCIRCGACARVCPVTLLPHQLYWYSKAKEWDQVEAHHIFACIECGSCAYVCPSHIPLVDYYRNAKSVIRENAHQHALSDHARQRHLAREERIEREKAERAERMAKKKAALQKKTGAEKLPKSLDGST